MSPRQKKPPVTPDKRREWLERNEFGESPPKIATSDKVDVRTVRKHIDIAKQEKETKEARASVLRYALERHYADLCRCAERMGGQSSDIRINEFGERVSSTGQYEQQLEIALRQHLPRSPIWGLIKQRPKLYTGKDEFIKRLSDKIEGDVTSDSRLLAELNEEESGVIPGLVIALPALAQQWVRGYANLNVEDNLKVEPPESGFVYLSYGAYNLGKVKQEHVELVRTVILDWTVRIKEWDLYHALEKTSREIERVENKLRDEIAVIALRRVVPGRCRYCPV
jgi:hypothetical protein